MSDFAILALLSMAQPVCLAVYFLVVMVVKPWWVGVPSILLLRALFETQQGTLGLTASTLAALSGAAILAVVLYAVRDAVRRLRHGGPSGETIWAPSQHSLD